MKTSLNKQEWVVGFFKTTPKAEGFIRMILKEGADRSQICVLAPTTVRKKYFAGIKREALHPEWHTILKGGVMGMIIGGVGLNVVIALGGPTTHPAMDMATGFLGAFAGAIVGSIFGMLGSGVDTSLNSYYESFGSSEIMAAIRCHPKNKEFISKMERLIRKAGSLPHEVPPLPSTMRKLLAHR